MQTLGWTGKVVGVDKIMTISAVNPRTDLSLLMPSMSSMLYTENQFLEPRQTKYDAYNFIMYNSKDIDLKYTCTLIVLDDHVL